PGRFPLSSCRIVRGRLPGLQGAPPCRPGQLLGRVVAMRQFTGLLGVAVCAALLTGCVDRKYIITTNPPGAVVYVNNVQLGASPVDNHFVYYGDYEFLLV